MYMKLQTACASYERVFPTRNRPRVESVAALSEETAHLPTCALHLPAARPFVLLSPIASYSIWPGHTPPRTNPRPHSHKSPHSQKTPNEISSTTKQSHTRVRAVTHMKEKKSKIKINHRHASKSPDYTPKLLFPVQLRCIRQGEPGCVSNEKSTETTLQSLLPPTRPSYKLRSERPRAAKKPKKKRLEAKRKEHTYITDFFSRPTWTPTR